MKHAMMTDALNRRSVLAGIAALATGPLVVPTRAWAAYPQGAGTIRIIIPFAAGGASDLIARLLVDYIGDTRKTAAVIENVPGGAATVGINRVAKGPTDGSEIVILPLNYVTTEFIMAHLPYDPEHDIVPLTHLSSQANLLCVRKDLPVASVKELIAYAKANPGALNYASSGAGSPLHLAAELFKQMTGTQIVHVPYAGSAPAKNDLVGGHIDLMFDNVVSIIGLARSGAVRALAITSAERSSLTPEYPTVAETVPGYAAGGWFGLGVRAGTPPAICAAIERIGMELMQQAPTKERLAKAISEPVGSDARTFQGFLAAERLRWGDLIKTLGIKS